MIDEQELNKKLAEWRELKDFRIYADHKGNYYKMQFTDPQHSQMYIVCDAFHLSLDACFKWLVPKLKSGVTVYASTDGYSAYLGLHDYESEETKEPALALCLAIEKFIDGEKQ